MKSSLTIKNPFRQLIGPAIALGVLGIALDEIKKLKRK